MKKSNRKNISKKHSKKYTLATLPAFQAIPADLIKGMKNAQSEAESFRIALGFASLLAALDKDAFVEKMQQAVNNGGQEIIIEMFDKLEAWSDTFECLNELLKTILARILLVGELVVENTIQKKVA